MSGTGVVRTVRTPLLTAQEARSGHWKGWEGCTANRVQFPKGKSCPEPVITGEISVSWPSSHIGASDSRDGRVPLRVPKREVQFWRFPPGQPHQSKRRLGHGEGQGRSRLLPGSLPLNSAVWDVMGVYREKR